MKEVGHEGRPIRLAHGAKARRVVAVEVLEEEHIVLPRRIARQSCHPAEDGAAPIGSRESDADQPSPTIGGKVRQGGKLSRSGSEIRAGILSRRTCRIGAGPE
jgi:hypothetical protein